MGLRPASRVRPEESSDGQERPGRRPRFLPESLATEHDYGSPMSPGAASHRGPGTVPVQQTQQASSYIRQSSPLDTVHSFFGLPSTCMFSF